VQKIVRVADVKYKKVKTRVLAKQQDGANLHFLSPQPETSLHCKTTDTRTVHCTVCLFTVLTARTHKAMARLSSREIIL